jgi:hypothetical protein
LAGKGESNGLQTKKGSETGTEEEKVGNAGLARPR